MFLKRYKNLYEFKKYYKKHTKLIVMLVCVMLIASSMGVLLSYLMSEQLIGITDSVIDKTVKFTLFIIIVVTIHHICWFLWNKFEYKLTKKILIDMRSDMVSELTAIKYSSIKNKGSGYYLERINDDTIHVASFLSDVLGTLVDVFTNLSFLVIIYFLNWQCGLFFTLGISLLFVVESIKVKVDLKNLNKVKDSQEEFNTKFNEIIHGIKDIKGFGIKNEVKENINKSSKRLLNDRCKKDTQYVFISRIGTYLQWMIDSILVLMSILWLIPSGKIEVVVLLIIFNYKGLMYDTVGFFSKFKGYYVNGDYYASRILEVISCNEKDSYGSKKLDMLTGSIMINNLSFSYETKKILDNINLKILPNTLNVLIGNSGSGKSTLFMILSKLYNVDNGVIQYDDIDINNIDEITLKNNVCIVNQEPFLFNDTIFNNIKIVNKNASYEEVVDACKLANIHDEIEELSEGYNTIINENGSNLSGGQKQRIELARAILKDSKILLLDEPTSALDSNNQKKLINTLIHLKENKTIFMIAHKLSDYEGFDSVYKLNNGKIN
jgi:ABC-type multidrug transport system fused ATPase/permease subunit